VKPLAATATHRGRRCERCHDRWAQARGLCRLCDRDMHVLASSRFAEEQARLTARQARIAALRKPPPAPFVEREICIGRERFVITWDGS